MPSPRPILLAGATALMVLIWGTTWAAIRIGLTGIPPFTGIALRFAIAAGLLFLLSPALGVRYLRSPSEPWLWVINGLLGFSISYGVIYWGEQWVPSGLAAVLFATFPLFVGILAHFLLPGEYLGPSGVIGVLVGFGGVAVIFSEDFARLGAPRVASAAAVMLSSPVVMSVANVCVKRWGKEVHPVSITVVPMALTSVVMGVAAWIAERDRPIHLTPASVGALLYLAILGSAVAFTVYYWVLRHVSATRLALITYAIPVVAVLVGAVFLDEPVTVRTLVGSGLVVAGVALATRGRRRASA